MMKRGSWIDCRYSAVPSVEPLSQITISRVASLVRSSTFSTHWRRRWTRLWVRTTMAMPSSASVTRFSMANSGSVGAPDTDEQQHADEQAGGREADGDAGEGSARQRELEGDEDDGGDRPAPSGGTGLVGGEHGLRERARGEEAADAEREQCEVGAGGVEACAVQQVHRQRARDERTERAEDGDARADQRDLDRRGVQASLVTLGTVGGEVGQQRGRD